MASRQKLISNSKPRLLIGWSKIADGCALDYFKTIQNLQTNKFFFDLEPDSKGFKGGETDKLRCLFNHFVSIFLKEICGTSCFRPFPPMLGNGKSVDLFKLYLLVRTKGGYETVSENGLWVLVAKESGLDSDAASALKLIYIKYLHTLDKWVQRIVTDKDSKGGLQVSEIDPSGFSMDLTSEFKGYFSEILDQKKNDGEHLDLENSELSFAGAGKLCKGDDVQSFVESDGDKEDYNDKKCIDNDKNDMIWEASVDKEDESNRKRKRECHSALLNWVTEVAKDPCDPAIGSLPERSKWKSYGTDQLWKQVLLAREAMLLKRNVDSSDEQSIWQKKQKMHPTMYENHIGSERSRCSKRILSVKESQAILSFKMSQARACSESSSSVTQSDLEDHFDKQSDPLSADSVVRLWGDNHSRKRIPVGPYFQAKVPEWTGDTYEGDSKWLGVRVWPLEKGEKINHLIERDRIGKGRQDSCGCQFPGSLECVRFHVAEKRNRVKLELCSAFQRWNFDKMGEEVALSWTHEEEKKFQTIVRSNPLSLDKCFWDEICKFFHSKSRGDLVSYYFNVFLLQRRGYQNRSTPSYINSDDDDDEPESGSITNGIGHGAVKSSGSILCSPKKLHLNFR